MDLGYQVRYASLNEDSAKLAFRRLQQQAEIERIMFFHAVKCFENNVEKQHLVAQEYARSKYDLIEHPLNVLEGEAFV